MHIQSVNYFHVVQHTQVKSNKTKNTKTVKRLLKRVRLCRQAVRVEECYDMKRANENKKKKNSDHNNKGGKKTVKIM